MVGQIFLLPQVKRSVLISNKLVYASCEQLKTYLNLIQLLPSAQSYPRNENFVSASKNLMKNRT